MDYVFVSIWTLFIFQNIFLPYYKLNDTFQRTINIFLALYAFVCAINIRPIILSRFPSRSPANETDGQHD